MIKIEEITVSSDEGTVWFSIGESKFSIDKSGANAFADALLTHGSKNCRVLATRITNTGWKKEDKS